ncbi:TetR/AcrR family transcriptional regulator [Streptomyces sp. NPDC020707]|jgi:AcrR family transcriptional regulator|uniref:TetR family transcriptional regulator C-terminal domain-containing protein n=1 Tax=Streptomyces ortus TaxID=2867268 RepID=A0ABT3V963_9ACTN|nr:MULTISPECIES: TetR family transcriptional regulator C-terminal domain-containing protein [Streptomyces]MCX4235170.1 TetR family transcriptional regulator C-terminal domain-containing protein [Streptomyces ortus]
MAPHHPEDVRVKPAKTPRRAVAAADRTRQPTEVRRRLIVEAAVPLIAERGYASVGVRDVAAAAGVSVGTVTYHFGSVQEILSEAMVLNIERYYAALNDAAQEASGGAEALRLLIDALFTEDTDRHWRMWFDYWSAGDRDQDPEQAFAGGQAKRYEDWHGQIRALVERGVADGEFVCVDPAGFTVRFAALSDGLALQRLRQAPPLSTEDARRHMYRLVETELGDGGR